MIRFRDSVRELRPRVTLWNYAHHRVIDQALFTEPTESLSASASGLDRGYGPDTEDFYLTHVGA